MKSLLILPALLLLSVDAFADDKICREDWSYGLEKIIQEQCKDGDLLWVTFTSTEMVNTERAESIKAKHCSFEHEISLTKRPNDDLYLQCILNDNEPRKERLKD